MEAYKIATKKDLRFKTPKGLLTVLQLWSLSMMDLTVSIKEAKKELQSDDNDDDLSFLSETKTVDIDNQVRFDVLKDIYLTKKQEKEEARNNVEKKEMRHRILEILKEKEEGELKGKSKQELEEMLKTL